MSRRAWFPYTELRKDMWRYIQQAAPHHGDSFNQLSENDLVRRETCLKRLPISKFDLEPEPEYAIEKDAPNVNNNAKEDSDD